MTTPARITVYSTPPINLRAVRDNLARVLAGAITTKEVPLDALEKTLQDLDTILESREETR